MTIKPLDLTTVDSRRQFYIDLAAVLGLDWDSDEKHGSEFICICGPVSPDGFVDISPALRAGIISLIQSLGLGARVLWQTHPSHQGYVALEYRDVDE